MKKSIWILLILTMLVTTMVACDRRSVETPAPPMATGDQQQGKDSAVVDPAPKEETKNIILYYVNKEYVVTGNEALDKVVPVEKEITMGKEPLESIIMAELQKDPEDDKLETAIGSLKILSVDVAENIAYVNISSEKLNGGSLQETLVLSQIVYSLTELPEVEAVQFFVDGGKRETLMGHFTIEEPLKRKEI